MNKKTIAMVIGSIIIIGGLSFYGGLKYGKKDSKFAMSQNMFGQGQMRGGSNRTGMQRITNGFIGGTIVALDEKSMTVSMRDGSSKIIFFTTATPVMKMVAGKADDMTIGKDVTITGTTNSDGSVSAESIQIRDATGGRVNN